MKIDNNIKKYVMEQWNARGFTKKYGALKYSLEEYEKLQDFKIDENVEQVGGITEGAHKVMMIVSQYYMEKVFAAMKIDMNDGNVAGDKGTPYRIVKMWTGKDLGDETELMCGRWADKPRLATFDNDMGSKFPITKQVDVVSVCSHHAAPFSTMFREDSYAIVSYIPKDKVLGISKLQRIVDWVARRGHLQETLTKAIYTEVSKAAETDDVYVGLFSLVHTCEKLRGSQANEGAFTSEYYGGKYEETELRNSVKKG